MSEPLLKIYNHHTPDCGDPPIIDGNENYYVGYFENACGEQWVFTHDRDTGKSVLRGGDAGWTTEFEVLNGRVDALILSEGERLWLKACIANCG